MAQSVVYKIDAEGLHPVPDKVRAVQEAPEPRNVSELKSYIGLLSYYSKILPNLSTVLAPLYQLLRKDQPWMWKQPQVRAFKEPKNLLLSSQVLVHFDPNLEICLACDASDYGIGAVLSHRMSDGYEKPIGFVSHTLSEAEKKYSQIEKEALACVVGVQRFRSYLWGHHFILQTDHKPLLTLFNENKIIPQQAAGYLMLLHYLHKLCIYRLYLASLHYNENKGRNQAKTKEGIRRFSIHFPKYKRGAYIVRKIMEDSTFGKITSSTTV